MPDATAPTRIPTSLAEIWQLIRDALMAVLRVVATLAMHTSAGQQFADGMQHAYLLLTVIAVLLLLVAFAAVGWVIRGLAVYTVPIRVVVRWWGRRMR